MRRTENIYNKEINNRSGGLNAESSKIIVISLTQMVAQVVRNSPAMQETWVGFLGQKDSAG